MIKLINYIKFSNNLPYFLILNFNNNIKIVIIKYGYKFIQIIPIFLTKYLYPNKFQDNQIFKLFSFFFSFYFYPD